jgi:hypothetical protein
MPFAPACSASATLKSVKDVSNSARKKLDSVPAGLPPEAAPIRMRD